jgi:hypothetical protein
MSIDLIKFLQAWALQWAAKNGGAANIDWDRTNKLFAASYDKYGVDVIWSMGDYNITKNDKIETSLYSAEYGPFATEKNINFSHSTSVTDSFEWNITETVALGISASVSAGLPGIFSAEAGMTFDLSVSSTQGQSKQASTSWDTSLDLILPAGDISTLEMMVTRLVASGTTTLIGSMSGQVAIGLKKKLEGQYIWFVKVSDLAKQYNKRADITVVDEKVIANIVVAFAGTAATETYIRQKRTTAAGQVVQSLHAVNSNSKDLPK